jgi:hypothetical protein
MLKPLDQKEFIFYKDQPNTKSIYGIEVDRIVEIPMFVTKEQANTMIKYFESKAKDWGPIAFFGSEGMSIIHEDPAIEEFGLPKDFIKQLMAKYKDAIELLFKRKVKPVNICHAQKWNPGGEAAPHSDNSSLKGEPNPFETNKFVSLLYLNDDYEGGEIYFPDAKVEFQPKACSWVAFNGGIENLHGVRAIKKGTRYTFVSFWDFEEAEYNEETRQRWEDQIKEMRKEQEVAHKNWGNKSGY